MGKAINSLINKSEEESDGYNPNVIRLSCVDVLHPKGSRDKAIVRVPRRNTQVKLVVAVRKVTYIYDKKTTTGWEIVKEVDVPLEDVLRDPGIMDQQYIECDEVTRDCRTPGYTERKPREEYVQEEV